MSLSFITGAPGSGKTKLTGELLNRGCAAFDTDDPKRTGIAGWHNLETGKYVAGFNEIDVTEDLLKTHIWRLTDAALDRLTAEAEYKQTYLCGRLRDAEELIKRSDFILFLVLSGETIKNRLVERSKIPGEVDWGSEQWQIDRSIKVNQEIEADYRRLGAVMIDAERPISLVADQVIKVTTK